MKTYYWNEKACIVNFIPIFQFLDVSMKKPIPKDSSFCIAIAVISLNPFWTLQLKLHRDLMSKIAFNDLSAISVVSYQGQDWGETSKGVPV